MALHKCCSDCKIPFAPVLRYENHGVDAVHIKKFAFGLKCTRLVFINGHYAPEFSAITPRAKGVKVMKPENGVEV